MRRTLTILLVTALTGCATAPEPEYQSPFAGAQEVTNPAWKSQQQHADQNAERSKSERTPSRREIRR